MSTAIRSLFDRGMMLALGPIARGSITSVVIKLTGIGLSFIQAILAARLLGAEGYGLVAVALAVTQIASTFAVFGYGTLTVREIAGWLSSGKQQLLAPFSRHAVTLVAGLSLLAAGTVVLAVTLVPQQLAAYRAELLIGALITPALALIKLFRGFAQGFGDVAGAQWPGEVLRPLLLILMIIAAAAMAKPFTAPMFLTLFAIAGFIGVIVSGFLVQKHLAAHRVNTSTDLDKSRWVSAATPFFAISIIAIIQGELATLMLAALASPSEAGLFQPIARLTPLIALAATAAAMRYTPRISEFWNSGQLPRLIKVTKTYTLVTAGLTALATLTLAGLGPWILLAFGKDFVSVAPLLWIVGAAQIFSTGCGPVSSLLTMTGHTRIATISKIIGLIAAFLACWFLIPAQGALGAAIAVSLGLITWPTISLIAVRKLVGFDPSLLQLLNAKQSDVDGQK